MTYLHAFLLGGLFCLLTQLLFRLTKWPIPVILTVAFCLGVVMTALGWMDVFTGFGQSGMFLLLYGGGDAAYRGYGQLACWGPRANPSISRSHPVLLRCGNRRRSTAAQEGTTEIGAKRDSHSSS